MSFKSLLLSAFAGLFVTSLSAQQPTMDVIDAGEAQNGQQSATGTGQPAVINATANSDTDIQKTEMQVLPWAQDVTGQRVELAPDYVREADVFWKKELWRVIDTREKMNLPFAYPKKPLIDILLDAVKSGEVPVFSPNDDDFKNPIDPDDALQLTGATTDTIYVPDAANPDILIPTVVTQEFNFEDVKQYRIKEVWYFNQRTSTMQARILGIAPVMDDYSETGVKRGVKALFWIYMPSMRNILVKTEAYNPFPDGIRLTWDDIFTQRLFSSVVYKEDNVRDERVKDIWEDPIDQLYESERIKEKIFNFEHDLWEY